MTSAAVATATYYDARITQAERLCFELVDDGEATGPHARALNHVAVTGSEAGAVTLTDGLTGRTSRVRPSVVINAAGPWIDQINQAVGVNRPYMAAPRARTSWSTTRLCCARSTGT